MRLKLPLPCALVLATTAACGASAHQAPSGATAAPAGPDSTTAAPRAPATAPAPGNPSSDDWPTYDHDPSRTGVDPLAPPLGRAHLAWNSPILDGAVYAQPLVIGTEVIVATENDTVYALDRASGTLKWSRHLGSPVPGEDLPCGNIDPSGITGTPVADAVHQTLWVVTFSTPVAHTLWSLDLSTGRITSSRPADPPGAQALTLQQRGALLLDAGRVYIPYGGLYGDCGDYHGWVLGYSTATTNHTAPIAYETQAGRAGIWAPPGPVLDAGGDILVATGNGLPPQASDDAQSVLRLAAESLSVVGRFTDPHFARLSEADADLGSISPLLLPGGNVLQAGKEGTAYLLHPELGSPIGSFHACGGAIGAGAVDGSAVFLACFDGLHALRVSSGGSISEIWAAPGTRPGPPIVAGGVVWTVDRRGMLIGFDETTGTRVFSHGVAVAGSFPTSAASGGQLFVADGSQVVCIAAV